MICPKCWKERLWLLPRFRRGAWTIRGGVPLVVGGAITENDTCCCAVAPDCDTGCDAGTIPAQIKITIASMVDTASDIGAVPCDNPGTCPTGDYFLDLVDTGTGHLCLYKLCVDDPCNNGNKLSMVFGIILDWTSTYLAWFFTLSHVCSSDCSSCTGAEFQEDVDQVIGDFDFAYDGLGFDCNTNISGTAADNLTTVSGVPSTTPYCQFTSFVTATAVP